MSDQGAELDFDRIAYLLNPDVLWDKVVTIVGLGSGGAPVCDHLSMNGVRRWNLYDPDVLDGPNLVKHPRMRRDLGRLKVEVQQEWLFDRNPDAVVNAFAEDVMASDSFVDSVRESDLILACPDKKRVREFISDRCVELGVPFVAASVFRTGIGGEVYGFVPDETGCYRCVQLYSMLTGGDLTDEALGLTDHERQRIYGLGDIEFRASGLSIDIQTISLIQARMALSYLLRGSGSKLPELKANWIIFGNRPAPDIFSRHLEARQQRLRPQAGCICGPMVAV